MQQVWSSDQLKDHWLLNEQEYNYLKGKTHKGRLLFAFLLKYFQSHACFPSGLKGVPEDIWDFLSGQLSIEPSGIPEFEPDALKRMLRRYAKEIRQFLGIRSFDNPGRTNFKHWIISWLLPRVLDDGRRRSDIQSWFCKNRYEIPSKTTLDRLFNSAEREFEHQLFGTIVGRLGDHHKQALEGLLDTSDGISEFGHLCGEPGKPSLESVLQVVSRLDLIRSLNLPFSILDGLHPALIEKYLSRAGSENAWELRRHPEIIRLGLLCFYCIGREAELVDSLIDLLVHVTHKISVRAEKRVVSELINELTKVNGKTTLLFHIAVAANDNPDGIIRDVIFPIVGEKTIHDLVKEYQSSGPAYTKRIYRKIRSSYAQHYRRMLPLIISRLRFRSNISSLQPLLDAVSLLQNYQVSSARYFSVSEAPIDGVVRKKWQEAIIEETATGEKRINRISYEICVLHSLRDKLRTKQVWVDNARRYCDPDKDLPQDFKERRKHYYSLVGQPLHSAHFIDKLQRQLQNALREFNDNFPNNENVRIKYRGDKAKISLTPFKPLPDPKNLDALRDELSNRWSMTNLLDALKETDFRTGFTSEFTSLASRYSLDKETLSQRLLLAIYGMGTNIGLKALSGGPHEVSYKELRHIRLRFLHKENLRKATRMIANATMKIRLPEIWGEGTSSCGSDSTQFPAWDQNLMTEWHQRYGGRGVMIYWHVDTNATCIYSQLKRCSPSEVASMIEGVLHHCTDMEIDRHYVDTHGQSIIAFAFCYLLGFDLMPRFKGIENQKLKRPFAREVRDYPYISPLFTQNPVNWEIIAQQYDDMILLASALLERTADPEDILRRFTRHGEAHPTYKALLELGKAVKTIFLCQYLGSEDLRREIHSGLNVVERWNRVNSFIHYGRSGEFATNRVAEQEISALCLHLLQASMVYINTLMIQEVLHEPGWRNRMTARDWEGLSPLPYKHYNPYGYFDLDMSTRLPLNELEMVA